MIHWLLLECAPLTSFGEQSEVDISQCFLADNTFRAFLNKYMIKSTFFISDEISLNQQGTFCFGGDILLFPHNQYRCALWNYLMPVNFDSVREAGVTRFTFILKVIYVFFVCLCLQLIDGVSYLAPCWSYSNDVNNCQCGNAEKKEETIEKNRRNIQLNEM